MINESLGLFLRFDLPEYFRKTFYPEIFKYFDYVLPILKEGNHTRDNEMECVGSQYLHLSYLEQDDSIYVVFRNEQHADCIFKIENNSLYKSIEVSPHTQKTHCLIVSKKIKMVFL